ncbi:hypothetical protein HUJ04_004185 [Dendroctonus ponderosae]|nr:hypothetical protein HUJ04_004185 [Dendroctonus ponderosae]
MRGAKDRLLQYIMQGKIAGKRGLGRRKTSRLKNIRDWCGVTSSTLFRMAVSSVQMAVLVIKLETVSRHEINQNRWYFHEELHLRAVENSCAAAESAIPGCLLGGALLELPHSPASNCLPRSIYEFLPLVGRQDAWVAKIRSGGDEWIEEEWQKGPLMLTRRTHRKLSGNGMLRGDSYATLYSDKKGSALGYQYRVQNPGSEVIPNINLDEIRRALKDEKQ